MVVDGAVLAGVVDVLADVGAAIGVRDSSSPDSLDNPMLMRISGRAGGGHDSDELAEAAQKGL